MQIIFARCGFSPTGGAERYLGRLVAGLREEDIESILFNDGSWPQEDWPGNSIRFLKAQSPAEFAREVDKARKEFPKALLFSFERIPGADIFRAGDGVHTAFLHRQAAEGNPLATWFRSKRRLHRETCALERQLFTQNKHLHVICNSEMVASELNEIFAFDTKRTHIIYNGFTPKPWTEDERLASRAEIRNRLSIPADAPVILFVGSGWKRKGAETLASAFKKIAHPKAHLVLVGKGRLRQSTSDRIHLTGPVSNPRPYFLAADLFALPTLYDPFSNACLEAAAFGLPVLTSDGNGFAEALTRFPGAGEVIPIPRRDPAWTEALDRWLNKATPDDELHSLVNAHTMIRNVKETVSLLGSLAARA